MSLDINDRTWPEEWPDNYFPLFDEDNCRYCKHGFIHTNFRDELSWACGKPDGNFWWVGNPSIKKCPYFKKHEGE